MALILIIGPTDLISKQLMMAFLYQQPYQIRAAFRIHSPLLPARFTSVITSDVNQSTKWTEAISIKN